MRKLTACLGLYAAIIAALGLGVSSPPRVSARPLLFGSLQSVMFPGPGTTSATNFVKSTYVAQGSSTVSSITSPALTLSAGQFVYVFCRNGAGTSIATTVTSTPSNTFNQLTLQYYSSPNTVTEQASYAMNVGAGSTTFTCTPSTAENYQAMVVLVYAGIATSSALDTQAGSVSTSAQATYTSPSFTTTTGDLIILCGTLASESYAFTAGSVGSGSAILRQVDAATPGNNAGSACEDFTSTSAQGSITASMTYGNAGYYWASTVAAFK